MRLEQLRRLAKVVSILNTGQVVTTEEIRKRVSEALDKEYCKSTIEKDVFLLRMEFDLDIQARVPKGLQMKEPVDFVEHLKKFLE